MIYEIQNLQDDGDRFTWDTAFWSDQASKDAGDDPFHVEDFIGLPAARVFHQIVTDGGGQFLRQDGSYIIPWVEIDGDWQMIEEDPLNPWQRVDVPLDVPAYLADAVAMFLATNLLEHQ